MKKEFIKKWSSWWILQEQSEELTFAFENELDELIKDGICKADEMLHCPFCNDIGFDKPGLKYHLNTYCKKYEQTEL